MLFWFYIAVCVVNIVEFVTYMARGACSERREWSSLVMARGCRTFKTCTFVVNKLQTLMVNIVSTAYEEKCVLPSKTNETKWPQLFLVHCIFVNKQMLLS